MSPVTSIRTRSQRQPQVILEKIDPAIAAQYLLKAARNRNIRERWVDQLAGDMLGGRYKLNPNPIAFDLHGNLIDGQHRLSAIMKSGKTVFCFVARDLDEDTKDIIDTGRSRSVGDSLAIAYGIQNGHAKSAVCNMLHVFQTEAPMVSGLSTAETIQMHTRLRDPIEWSIVNVPDRMEPGVSVGGAPVRTAFMLAKLIAIRKTEKALRTYLTGDYDLEPEINRDIIKAMRAASVRPGKSHSSRWSRYELLMKFLRGLEAIIDGKDLGNLRVDEGIFARIKKRLPKDSGF